MNKKKLLLTLAIGMMLGGCKNENKIKPHAKSYPVSVSEYLTDTLFVAGVLHQPAASGNGARKYLKCVNKQGNIYDFNMNIMPDAYTIRDQGRDAIISYIERGDTIVVQDGVIVKNITMDNMINRYVNGR